MTYRLLQSQLKHLVSVCLGERAFFATFDGKFIIKFSLFEETKVDRVLGVRCGDVLSSFSYDPFEKKKKIHSKNILCSKMAFVNPAESMAQPKARKGLWSG